MREELVERVAEPVHATWRALLPLLHSTLEPTSIRALQQGQNDANLAVMIMTYLGGGWFRGAVPAVHISQSTSSVRTAQG